MFELWLKKGKILPFTVQSIHWNSAAHFNVKRVDVSPNMWSYFRDGGKLYGKAYGDFLSTRFIDDIARGVAQLSFMTGPSQYDVELKGACFFEWKFAQI